jgi:Family of unknown function (DUF6152)
MTRTLLGAALTAVLAGQAAVSGHHPTARVYRVGEHTTIEGVIVSLVVRTPHSFLHVEAPDRFNKMRVWAIECDDSRGFRQHVEDRALKIGDRVAVTGNPALDEGLWRLRLRSLVRRADGWQWNEVDR